MTSLRSLSSKLKPSTRLKVRLPEKRADGFYLSKEWRDLIDSIIVERFGHRSNARCEDLECKAPHRRGIRVFGDHTIEIKDGGPRLDRRYILCRCGSCHTRVTAERRRQRYHRGVVKNPIRAQGEYPQGGHPQIFGGRMNDNQT